MVDSPKEGTMANESSNLPERVDAIETKLDGLIRSVDARFDQVDAAIVEQRRYAYEKLDSKMDAGFARLDSKMDAGFDRLDSKIDSGLTALDSVARLDHKIDDIDNRLGKVDGRFARVEQKIDQIIDLHQRSDDSG
jgi:hypothetical protein